MCANSVSGILHKHTLTPSSVTYVYHYQSSPQRITYSLHQNTVLWNIEPIITLYCNCQNVSTVVSQLHHIWVNLQYNEIYLQSILSETQFRFFSVLALGSYIINIWVTSNSYANKYGYRAFCQLFGLLCFILYKKRMHYDFYRSKMMSLSEMHNVVVCI